MLPSMLIVGLTGGIGSGKSTVSELFANLGVPIVDADQVGHDLDQAGQPAQTRIAAEFGSEVLTLEGGLNRDKLREIVFSNPQKRETLESILHPLIKKEILVRIKKLQSDYCIVVVPLLIEKQWTDIVDKVVVVDLPEDLQKKRVAARDGFDEQQIKAIFSAQASRQERLMAADDVIVNDDDMQHLKTQVAKLHEKYLKLAKND